MHFNGVAIKKSHNTRKHDLRAHPSQCGRPRCLHGLRHVLVGQLYVLPVEFRGGVARTRGHEVVTGAMCIVFEENWQGP